MLLSLWPSLSASPPVSQGRFSCNLLSEALVHQYRHSVLGVWGKLCHHHTTLLSVAIAHFRADRPNLAPSSIGHTVPARCYMFLESTMPSYAEQHSLGPHSWSVLTPEGPYTNPGSKFSVLTTRVFSLVGACWELVHDINSNNPRLRVLALGHTPLCLVLVKHLHGLFSQPSNNGSYCLWATTPLSLWSGKKKMEISRQFPEFLVTPNIWYLVERGLGLLLALP